MDSVKRNKIIAGLLLGTAFLLIAMMIIPFQFTYSRHGDGPYILNCIGFLRSYSHALWWYDYSGGGDYHFVQIVMAIFTVLSLLLGVAGITFGIFGFVKTENKKVQLVTKILLITSLVVSTFVFLVCVAANVITVLHSNRVIPFMEIPYIPLLVVEIIALVFVHKEKKAQKVATAE